jgi:hypothetical protein
MQTVEVRLWDDLVHHQSKDKVPADVTVELTYKTKRGTKYVRLDLTEQHGSELDGLLAPYLAAGQPPEAASGSPEKINGGKIRRGPPGGPGGSAARQWRAELREWSDGLGLVNQEDPAFPAWKTVTDKHYYPADLEDAYTLHLDGREEEAQALVAKFKPQAA